MAVHVAILHEPYIRLILAGRKTVESRLTLRPLAPFGKIQRGQRIYFKKSGGAYMATAIAAVVDQREALTPKAVQQLCTHYNEAVCGEPAYWREKSRAKFATFITLQDVQPATRGPAMPKSQGLAWFVLPSVDTSPGAPAVDVPLTDGGVRNHYIRISDTAIFPTDALATEQSLGKPVTLVMPDGSETVTDIRRDGMIRWRGWGKWFAAAGARRGDMATFTAMEGRRYAVTIMRPAGVSHSRSRSRSAEASAS